MNAPSLSWDEIDPILDRALEEDLKSGDLTTESLIPPETLAEAEWVAKESCVIAGIPVVERILSKMDSSLRSFWTVKDGEKCEPGKFGLSKGPAQALLKAERTALNFLQRLSGIATLTAAFVEKAKAYGVKIYDTRKTAPGLRVLEKYAVRVGGGYNHRSDLNEMILVKDNHLEILEDLGVDDWGSLLSKIRHELPCVQMGVEVDTSSELEKAVASGADFALLDNMTSSEVAILVKRWKGKIILEASGGIRLDNVESYARTGVDRISIGSLTHSAKAVDIGLEILSVL